MTRCQAFYEKWEKDPNFCNKSLATVQRIDHYLDLVHELQAEGADVGAIYRKFPESTAREVLKLGSEKRKEIIQNSAAMIKRGEKVCYLDIRAWSDVQSPPIGGKVTPDHEVKPKSEPLHEPESTKTVPIVQTLKEKMVTQQPEFFDTSSTSASIPTAKTPEQIKGDEMNLLAEVLLDLMPKSIQLIVTDVMREHPSYKVKDVFYYGIEALGYQKNKGRA